MQLGPFFAENKAARLPISKHKMQAVAVQPTWITELQCMAEIQVA